MKIAIISLLPDSGHMINLLRIGELLKNSGLDVTFFGPEENANIAQQKNITHIPLAIQRPENCISNLAKLSQKSRLSQEVIWSKWFYLNYYEKAIYLGLKTESHLTEKVMLYNPDAILCDSHLFITTYELIASQLNVPIIVNIATGNYANFQKPDHESGILSSRFNRIYIQTLKKILGKFYTLSKKILFPKDFAKDSQVSKHVNEYWARYQNADFKKQKEIFISSGIGILEKKHLGNIIHIPSSIFQVGPPAYKLSNKINADLLQWIKADSKPIIYVGFGTMVKGTITFAENIIDAAKTLGFRVLWSHPTPPWSSHQDETWVRWESWVPQPDILSSDNVKIFISHCGGGAVQEAIWFGKPIISIPFLWDQFYNAWVIEKLFDIPALDKKAISTNSIKNHIKLAIDKSDLFKIYSKEFRSLEGSQELVQTINQFLLPQTNQ